MALIGEAESAHGAADDLGVFREDALHELVAGGGERGVSSAAVGLRGDAGDETALLELVDEEGDAAAGDEDLLLDFAEEESALVVEGFEDGELGFDQALGGDVGAGVGLDGCGRAHAQFETIHPFLDGNGRVGRLLITLLLCERKVLAQPVLYLSIFLKRHRTEYYERLQAVRDTGDWEGWLRFFLRGVAEVSVEATETARRIIALREEHRRIVTENLGRGAATGHRVLESLYANPITSVQEVRNRLGLTTAAANLAVARLTELGLLAEITGQRRNRRFRYEPYVQLFMT